MKEEFKKGGEADRGCHMEKEEAARVIFCCRYCCVCAVLQPGK